MCFIEKKCFWPWFPIFHCSLPATAILGLYLSFVCASIFFASIPGTTIVFIRIMSAKRVYICIMSAKEGICGWIVDTCAPTWRQVFFPTILNEERGSRHMWHCQNIFSSSTKNGTRLREIFAGVFCLVMASLIKLKDVIKDTINCLQILMKII